MEFIILRHAAPSEKRQLFTLIGEYFASASLRREFGRPMTSDDGYIWFLAMDGETVAAFAALHVRKSGSAELCHAYTLPEYRRQGLNAELVRRRLEWADSTSQVSSVFTIMKPERLPKYAPLGFTEHGQRGRYRVYTRDSK